MDLISRPTNTVLCDFHFLWKSWIVVGRVLIHHLIDSWAPNPCKQYNLLDIDKLIHLKCLTYKGIHDEFSLDYLSELSSAQIIRKFCKNLFHNDPIASNWLLSHCVVASVEYLEQTHQACLSLMIVELPLDQALHKTHPTHQTPLHH